ncbi:MAG: BMP family ABC transporter substrate-binding protein, partial [Rectinema sp.]
YDVCKLTMDGKFPGGLTNLYSIANKGVGIPDKNPNLSAEIVAKVREFEAQIASGKLKVSEIPAK